jgi:hypothetical protein
MKTGDMTDLQVRIRLAGLLDWDYIETLDDIPFGLPPAKRCFPSPIELPDYPQDLNAMHEAENACVTGTLLDDEDYEKCLMNVLGPRGNPIRATARQRAEALIEVMELR